MMDSQKFCLKWDGFHGNVTSLFDQLRQEDELVDVTLCCEGRRVRAHRMMLSACSPYFRELLKTTPSQQLVIFLKDTSAADLSAIVEFMYRGSVNVSQSQLASFIKTAEMLQVKGLSGDEEKMPASPQPASQPPPSAAPRPEPRPAATPTPHRPPRTATPPPAKRRRASGSAEQLPPTHHPPTPSQVQTPMAAQTMSQSSTPPLQASSAITAKVEAEASPVPPPSSLPSFAGRLPSRNLSSDETIKVEKVDLTEDDDDATLDSTLGYVAEFEGGYREETGFSAAAMANAAAAMGGGGMAGPSQRVPDDGSQSDLTRHVCNICGKMYKHRESLNHHKKKHEGLTTCFVCGKVCCIVAELRRHLELNHGLTQEEVRRIVPTKPKERIPQPFRAAGMLGSHVASGMPPLAMANAMQYAPALRTGFGQSMGWLKPDPGVRAVGPAMRTVDPGDRAFNPNARAMNAGTANEESLRVANMDPGFGESSEAADFEVVAGTTHKQDVSESQVSEGCSPNGSNRLGSTESNQGDGDGR